MYFLNDKLRGMTQILLPAKFHRFKVSGLFFIHKNRRVQFFMKHGVVGKQALCVEICIFLY